MMSVDNIYIGMSVHVLGNDSTIHRSVCHNNGCANYGEDLATKYCPYCGCQNTILHESPDNVIQTIINELSGDDTPMFKLLNNGYIVAEGPWMGGYWLPTNKEWDISSLFNNNVSTDKYPVWTKLIHRLDGLGISYKMQWMFIPVSKD